MTDTIVESIYKLIPLESPQYQACGHVIRGYDMFDLLPEGAKRAGFQLHDLIFELAEAPNSDPVCLHNKEGRLLYAWPEGYVPTLQEVSRACGQFLEKRA